MNINKRKFTKLILDTAFKFPFLFPKATSNFAKNYHSNSETILTRKAESIYPKRVSFVDSNFYWKSLSFSFLFSNDELDKLRKWKDKRSLRIMESERRLNIKPTSFDGGIGWVNIGFIRINKDSFIDDMNSVYMDNDYFSYVYITLSKYTAGLSFVTFYIGLNPETTNLIKDLPAPEMDYFIELETLNLFSKKRRGLKFLDRTHLAEELIKNNMRKLYNASWNLMSFLLDEMKTSKEKQEAYCVADLYLDQTAPYLEDTNFERDEAHHIVLPKYRYHSAHDISENKDEHFILDEWVRIEEIDMIYMKVCPEKSFKEYDNFKNMACSNHESHLAVIVVYLINKKINKISKAINESRLFDRKYSMSKLHEQLFFILHELQIINSWLKSLTVNLPFNLSRGYKINAMKRINYMISRVVELKETTGSIYALSENRIQIRNVKYNQRYSIIVFLFVIIQVLLAAMTIDWSKKNVWYSPIVAWLKNIIT